MEQTKPLSDSNAMEAEATAPGYLIERRFFIQASSIAAAALALASAGRVFAGSSHAGGIVTSEEAALDFEEFVKECAELAKSAKQESGLNEEFHIFRLSAV